jgi:hypothetical protein
MFRRLPLLSSSGLMVHAETVSESLDISCILIRLIALEDVVPFNRLEIVKYYTFLYSF